MGSCRTEEAQKWVLGVLHTVSVRSDVITNSYSAPCVSNRIQNSSALCQKVLRGFTVCLVVCCKNGAGEGEWGRKEGRKDKVLSETGMILGHMVPQSWLGAEIC